jgi:hypothetical protein
MEASPLVAPPLVVEPIGGKGKAEGAYGAASIIVATHWPQRRILIRLVGTQIDDPASLQVVVDGV